MTYVTFGILLTSGTDVRRRSSCMRSCVANIDIGSEPIFDRYHFSTYHEVARAAVEMAYVTLLILAKDLPVYGPTEVRRECPYRQTVDEPWPA